MLELQLQVLLILQLEAAAHIDGRLDLKQNTGLLWIKNL